MRPSSPLLDLPSSPASLWSCPRSPPTPPIMDLHLDAPYPCLLSDGDVELFLRDRGRWEYMYDHFESSPSRVPVVSHDYADDDFWEADPSRCSLLIHEVSLLVGLAPEDGYPSPDDTCLFAPDGSKRVPGILPLTLTPTKSLSPRKHRNTGIPRPPDTNIQANIPMLPNISPYPGPNILSPAFHIDDIPVRPVTPPARHKDVDGVRPSISPRRRQGQVFLVESPLGSRRNAVHLDETFLHPREPPPKPTPNSPANRCSSLDRLERSLLKLEAHAPHNHRKSQSEGDRVTQNRDRRPSLPPPPRQRLRKEQSSYEITHRNASRLALGHHSADPPPPVPRRIPGHQHAVPSLFPAVPSGEKLTPGSFMDMDIPCTEETLQKQQTSFRQLKNEKMKSLVRVAKRASRGVVALGKNLTGSTKPVQEMSQATTIQISRF